jgi:Ca2+:H+ antiporter
MAAPPGGRLAARLVWLWPLLALGFFGVVAAVGVAGPYRGAPLVLTLAVLLLPVLLGSAFAAVFHAEVIAHRTGEPYGTLILTVAVTVIEVALITSVMAAPGGAGSTLARDSVFAVVMIVCNGMVGLGIVIGGLKHGEQSFQVTGASAYLSVLMTLAVLTLVMPSYTSTTPGPIYSTGQLVAVSLATLALYAIFLYVQTVRNRDYFIAAALGETAPDDHGHPVSSARAVWASVGFLVLALVSVILLAKKFAVVLDATLAQSGAPAELGGVVVALLVLTPEAAAAFGAARRDELQKSINLALGSSLANIGLTVPAVATVAIASGYPLTLGIGPKETVLLALTFAVSLLTFATGRTTLLSGFVHLVLFAIYGLLVFLP